MLHWQCALGNNDSFLYRVSPSPKNKTKGGTLNFRYFDIRKCSIFKFEQIEQCLLNGMIPRSMKLVE